jgi:hypothetical protein
MVLSFHKYGNFNTTDAIKRYLDLRDQYKIPLWLGESGENSNTWFTEAIQLAEKNGIGWAWWQLKKMGINNPLEIKRPEGYDKLLAYWSDKGPKPSEEEAWNILQELLANLKIENNIYHPAVVDAMIRQVYSTDAKPFKELSIGNNTTIMAVDFDMGRQRYAYYDTDSARYQYTPGVNTDGNRGHTYRNDGVDIQKGKEGYYVFNIEDGEWLQYTVNVSSTGKYNISFITAGNNDSGIVSLFHNNKTIKKEFPLPATGGKENWEMSTIKNVALKKGRQSFIVSVTRGGFNLAAVQFDKIK